MYRKTFSLYDIFVTILSFVSYILDVLSDIAVIVLFFLDGSAVWGAVSLALVAVSTFAMQIFSFCWHVTDGTMNVKTFLLHAFFLAPLHRYWRVLKLGIKSRRTGSQEDIEAVYSANNDVCLLRLLESFLESAPQLILQLYIIISFHHFDWIIGLSTFFSLTSIAWSVSAYTDGLRLAYQSDYRRSGCTMLVLTLWQITMISGRVLAIVVFASLFKEWIVLVLGIHWLLMTGWITLQNADFGDTACEKRIFNAVSGFIYIFCFLNLKDGPSRKRQTIYYIVTLIENSILIILWFLYKPDTSPDWLSITTPTVLYGGFVIGSVMMFLYYRCCHPSMPNVKKEKEVENNWFKRIVTMKRREPGKTLFNSPESSFRISEWLTTSVNLSTCDRQNNSVQMSLNSSVPDVIPDKTSRFYRGESLSTYHRAPSIESSLQESDGNLTMESGRVSYISASSTKQLISSTAKTIKSPRYEVKAEVNQMFSHDQVSPSGYRSKQQDSPHRVPSSNNSFLKSSVENSLVNYNGENPFLLSCSRESSTERLRTGREDEVVPGSGNSSFEYNRKKISMSPLDPAKLWELSQQRIILENSRVSQESQQHGISPRSREDNSYYMTNPDAPSESVISGGRNSSARTSHYSTTFSDSQYNSEVSRERDEASYSGTSRNQWNSQSQTESWDNAQPSELSDFFADISSLHFPAPGHNRRLISSLSETTDPLNVSFPWPNDNDVFYDEGDISELVYKQKIREALHGKSYMYHICEISDTSPPRRLSYNQQSNRSSPHFINLTQRSDSSARISSEKSTDDSGYHYSEEADTNVSRSVNSYNRRDCVPKSGSHSHLNRALVMNGTSSTSSPEDTDHTGDGTSIRKSLLPGLSYLMSDSDTSYMEKSLNSSSSFMDAPMQNNITAESFKEVNYSTSQQQKNVSPLQVSVIETSPHRLGRSVDLFNSSRLELSDLEGPKSVKSQFPVAPPVPQLEKLQVLELKESPYKFRERGSDHVPGSAPVSEGKDDLHITDLMESPYKFRSQGLENTTQNRTNRKFYTIPEKREKNLDIPCRTSSEILHEDKENRFIGVNDGHLAPVSRNRKKKVGKSSTAYREKHTRPRTRVSALKNSCYAYSDTDSDGEVGSDFSRRSQYGDDSDRGFDFSSFKRRSKEFSDKDTRTALRSVENTPIFSPIVTPDHLDRERVCHASGPIRKPVVSTPVTRSPGENKLLFIDEPSTVAV